MFCGNCGKELMDEDYFCPYCGSKTEIADRIKTDKPVYLEPANSNSNNQEINNAPSVSFIDSWNSIAQSKLEINDNRPITHEYQKLGGWLAFVAYGGLISSAVSLLFTIIGFIGELSMSNSAFGGLLNNYVTVVYFFEIIAAAVFTYICYEFFVMIQKRDVSFLRYFETVSIASAGIVAGIYLIVILYMKSSLGIFASNTIATLFGRMIGTEISIGAGFAIWLAYFVKSVRVRTYFGTNEYFNKSILCKNIQPPVPAVPDR